MPKPRLLLIGWDAADWRVIRPLLEAGEMPNLATLMRQGLHGNLATIYPVLSPMLWTSIATGKRAYKHGIHGFAEPLPDRSGVRPISILSRKTKALWNILNQTGHRSIVVGWWPSHPAEPINGVMVSNHFHGPLAAPDASRPFPAGTIHPASLAETLADLRVSPMELSGEFIRPFVPEYEKVDQEKDKRLHALGKMIAETMSIHTVATELLATQRWDFAGVYYSAIDHFCHGFMRYHSPRLPWVPEEDFDLYKNVVAGAYRYHDAMLGAMLALTDQDTTVIVMSDHGFHPDHLRPRYIPAEPAGPAIEHRHFGVLCMKGPELKGNEQLFGASILDICPTVLTLFGLPPGKDMDGKVLSTAFRIPPVIKPLESWDSVAGDPGLHPAEMRLDSLASAEAFKQLVDLGYVAPPGKDLQETLDECTRELKYNLARAYRDGNRCTEAANLADELWTRWPKEHRFGILLIECLGALRQLDRRRAAIEELGRRIERYQAEAKTELAKREQEPRVPDRGCVEDQPQRAQPDNTPLDQHQPVEPKPQQTRRDYEDRQLRELAIGRPLLLEWFLASQALLEKKPAEAKKYLQQLLDAEGVSEGMTQQVAGALAQLGELDAARELLEELLESDPEHAMAYTQLASIHLQARRFDEAIAAATESLSLLYFQPVLHALLGRALMETKRFAEAEQELLVAAAQSPRNLVAHELLGQLYREHLKRPADAFAHEGRALSLRNEINSPTFQRWDTSPHEHPVPKGRPNLPSARETNRPAPLPLSSSDGLRGRSLPPQFEIPPANIITIVSGLPRSGTSMMMQLLAAAGRPTLTDSQRAADPDNPLGYMEFQKVLDLGKDASWLPEARGKAVKIVAQLLPHLPSTEHYNVLFMERDLSEVLASQKAMLARKGRPGAKLTDDELLETYRQQLARIYRQLARRPEFRILSVNYDELLANPEAGVRQIALFLGEPFDEKAAARSVHPELRRQRKT
ncbi:MAG TPA: alkaline phosphatase family protein [Candidatus Dormibacteraeota bacterium]|nr:alkaline phosphatase family protein [Candidatus Dormibacteraeota bacterium]